MTNPGRRNNANNRDIHINGAFVKEYRFSTSSRSSNGDIVMANYLVRKITENANIIGNAIENEWTREWSRTTPTYTIKLCSRQNLKNISKTHGDVENSPTISIQFDSIQFAPCPKNRRQSSKSSDNSCSSMFASVPVMLDFWKKTLLKLSFRG